VPVAAPLSADWSGSSNLHVGSVWGLRPWHAAWFDPDTGRLTGLRSSGSVELVVTVNGVTARATVPLTRKSG
jgi:hypothetical protein